MSSGADFYPPAILHADSFTQGKQAGYRNIDFSSLGRLLSPPTQCVKSVPKAFFQIQGIESSEMPWAVQEREQRWRGKEIRFWHLLTAHYHSYPNTDKLFDRIWTMLVSGGSRWVRKGQCKRGGKKHRPMTGCKTRTLVSAQGSKRGKSERKIFGWAERARERGKNS